MKNMNCLLLLTTLLIFWKCHQTAPVLTELEQSSLSKKLKELSKLGEEYLGQEVKKALLGVKQMKEIMVKNEEQHENIQKSLKKTKEEKEEAVRLLQDISEKLSEAELHCMELLKAQFDGCRTCLEHSCITFYSNSCSQQGLQEFVVKAHTFIKEWSPLSLNTQLPEDKYMDEYYVAAKLSQAEGTFNKLMSDVGIIYNQSMAFFTNFQKAFDESFQRLFLSDVRHSNTTTAVPDRDPVIISDDYEHWDFSRLFQSLYEFGQTIFEVMSDVAVTMYKKFNNSEEVYIPLQGGPSHLISTPSNIKCHELQNASECHLFQDGCQQCYESVMTDCPEVIELHLKSEAAIKLVNVSEQQYEDVVQLAQQHTDDTFHLVSQMKAQFGWVAEHTNMTNTIFNIEKMSFNPNAEDQNVYDTVVEVRIFTSPNVVIRLPANIDIESQEFIQYVTEKALAYHKQNF